MNVASRMQSTGEAMKIQMTYETKMLLDNLGGYVAEVRGQVEVKGKVSRYSVNSHKISIIHVTGLHGYLLAAVKGAMNKLY